MDKGIHDGKRNTGLLEEYRMVGEILDGWRNTGWLKITGWLEQNWMVEEYKWLRNTGLVEEYRMVGGIQVGLRNTGFLEEYRMKEGII